MMSGTKIAVAHKDYDVRGGGEVLAEHLARSLDSPLYVGHGDPANQPEDSNVDIREIAPESRWHRLMAMGGALRGIGHMMHWRDNAPSALEEYDVIVTSGNEPLWAMTQEHQSVVAYTHSPPRWMYDLYHESEGFVGRTYQQLQRRLYEGPVKRPDVFVANSDVVARRISKYWNIPDEQIRVVYPPIPTHEYSSDDAETGDSYLYLGRLDGAKCVDELLEAWQELDAPLIVAGDGPERDRLEAMAAGNVTFTGFVPEARKRKLYARAKALLYPPMNEDFGMVPIEAMAAGTPVIGVREGFTRHQLLEGQNGLLFDRSVENIRDAVQRFEADGVAWSEHELARWADHWFAEDRFVSEMREIIGEVAADTSVEPPWETGEPVEQVLKADGRGERE